MEESFREISDHQNVHNNLSFKNKSIRLVIRYSVILLNLDKALKLLIFLSFLMKKKKTYSYSRYLLEINLHRLKYLKALSEDKLKLSIKLKKDWATYVKNYSISDKNIANANLYLSTTTNFNKDHNNRESLLLDRGNPKKFYIYGPGSQSKPNPIYKDFTLVLLKPLHDDESSFKNKILFLNSYYFVNIIQDNDEIIDSLIQKYSKIYLSCMTSSLPNGFERVDLVDEGYIASEMALQRLLFFLYEKYGRFECVVEGFNFYLEKDAYKNRNYHKLTRDFAGQIDEKEICLSLAEHDFYFNFIRTQEIVKKIEIRDSEEFKRIITLDVSDYVRKLSQSRDFTSLKKIN